MDARRLIVRPFTCQICVMAPADNTHRAGSVILELRDILDLHSQILSSCVLPLRNSLFAVSVLTQEASVRA
jgi:hypothetical protein